MAVRVFALTGGIGSGKSTVATRFRLRGLPVVDADALARAVVEPGSPVLGELTRAFGLQILTAAGRLDRKQLAETVFSDAPARATLHAITHPPIRALARARFDELSLRGEPLACYEIPLLFETGRDAEIKPIVVVWVPEDLQIARARMRDHCSEAQVKARIAAQIELAEKARRADYRIDNSGSLEQTFREADRVLAAICEKLGVNPERYGLTSD